MDEEQEGANAWTNSFDMLGATALTNGDSDSVDLQSRSRASSFQVDQSREHI